MDRFVKRHGGFGQKRTITLCSCNDRDGLQEVYLALTDGTAYLRAIMEFDGNIRYANYQSQQEVIDYLAANGFGRAALTAFDAPLPGCLRVE